MSTDQLLSQSDHLSATLGVLLVLATIFTSAQSQTLLRQEVRAGNEPVTLVVTGLFALLLALITAASIWVMLPVVSGAYQHWRQQPPLALLLLVWCLLIPLIGWQLFLVASAGSYVWRNLINK